MQHEDRVYERPDLSIRYPPGTPYDQRNVMERRTIEVGPPTFEVQFLGRRVSAEVLDDYMRGVYGWRRVSPKGLGRATQP